MWPFPPARGGRRSRKPVSAGWQTVWLLAPLGLLAVLGVHGILQGRAAAHAAACGEAERVMQSLRPVFQARLAALRERSAAPAGYPLRPEPGEVVPVYESYEQALELPPAEALRVLKGNAEAAMAAKSPSGLPLGALVLWAILQRESTEANAGLLGGVVVQMVPSIITPELLERAAIQVPGSTAIARSRQLWQADEILREVLRENSGALEAGTPPRWIHHGESAWWAEPDHQTLIPMRELNAVMMELRGLLPPYASVELLAGDEAVAQELRPGEFLAAIDEGPFQLRALLSNPDALYELQRRQTIWLAALLASALAAEWLAIRALRRGLEREAHLNSLKSAFVSSVSHELRAPVASMRLMAENLEAGTIHDPERSRAYHKMIAAECRRLSAMIDNVLDFARIEQDRRRYRFAETDLAALTRDAIELMQPRATERGQELRAEIAELERVCDGQAMRQALINVIDNAIKFSPAEAAIEVVLKASEPGAWELSVADHGPGIPRAEQQRIFERFHRLGNELRRETPGAGIGLSIVRHIVEAHGGRVEVISETGAGARFVFVIPDRVPENALAFT